MLLWLFLDAVCISLDTSTVLRASWCLSHSLANAEIYFIPGWRSEQRQLVAHQQFGRFSQEITMCMLVADRAVEVQFL